MTVLIPACAGVALALLATADRAVAQEQAPAAARSPSPPPSLSPEAMELIEQLGSPDVTARIEASERLLDPAVASTRALEGVMVGGRLGAEQHRRLLNVILYRFFTEPRAAMGIQWNPLGDQTRSVVLSRTVFGRGFHAEQVLRPNDRIEAIDGVKITRAEQLPGLIVSHDPGDEVVLDIARDGKPLTVRLRLGDFTDLNENGGPRIPEQEAMIRGWLYRSAPYAARAESGVIDAGLAREAWAAAPSPLDAEFEPRNPRPMLAPDPGLQRLRPMAVELDELPSITAGGEARGAREETIFYGLGDARAHPAAVMAIQGDRDVRLQSMLTERMRRLQELSVLGAALGRQGLQEAQRLEMQRAIDGLERELDLINAEIQRLQRGR